MTCRKRSASSRTRSRALSKVRAGERFARVLNPLTIESNPRYSPDSWLDSAYWDTDKASVTRKSGDEYRVEFGEHSKLNEPPERYWINVTDEHGNERVVLIDVQEGGGAKIASAGVAAGTVGSLPSPDLIPDEVVRIPAGLLVLGVSAGGAYVANEYIPTSGGAIENEPVTGTERQYLATDTALETTVTLPTGGVSTEFDSRTGTSISHGHGWKHIDKTTGVTNDELGQVLSDNPTVHKHGEGDYTVIGRTDHLEEVVISIIGGTIMAASSDTFAEDSCGDGKIELETEEDHYTREVDDEPNKPFNSRSEVKDLLENADVVKVLKYPNGNRYYIIKTASGKYTVVFLQTISYLKDAVEVFTWLKDAAYRVKTFLTDRPNNQLFDRIDHAENAAKNYEKRPLEEVDC